MMLTLIFDILFLIFCGIFQGLICFFTFKIIDKYFGKNDHERGCKYDSSEE